jgi:hypothetical protein
MKKQLFAISIATFMLCFQSCEKDYDNTPADHKKVNGKFKVLSYNNSLNPNGRVIQSNILSFDSEEEFDALLDSLEASYNNF